MNVFDGFPYPILIAGGDDIGEGEFSWSLDGGRVKLGHESIEFTARFALTQAYFKELTSTGRALFSLEIHCPTTFFRRSIASIEDVCHVTIRSGDVRGEVIVSGYVIANEDLDDYAPTSVSEFFTGSVFSIGKGDVIAIGGTTSFIAEKEFDPFKAPVSSFIKVKEDSSSNGEVVVDYDSSEILITLSPEDFTKFQTSKRVPELLHSSIVFPVLVDAIHKMTSSDAYVAQEWSQKLQKICEAHRVSTDDAFEAAQKLLKKPVSRALGRYVGLEELGYSEDGNEAESV